MSDTVLPRPGSVVAWWNRNALEFAVVGGEEKQRVRLVSGRGKQERVRATRIAVEVAPPGDVPGDDVQARREAGRRAEQAEREARELASRIEVPLVWEVISEGHDPAPEGLPCALSELVALGLDEAGGAATAALMLALLEDGIHFYRKGDGWMARPPAVVRDLALERRRVVEREAQTAAFLEAAAAAVAGRPFELQDDPVTRRFLDSLERLAVEQEPATAATTGPALQALEASGQRSERPHEGAFRLLRKLGRFASDDENLQPLRFGLRPAFPAAVLAAAERAAAAGFARDGRRDLTDLETVSIDGPTTLEIDDLLSCEALEAGGLRVGVHIADPAAFVADGDPVDEEALQRCLTYYMPDLRLPMLPPAISERAASLIAGEERPALSFLVELDPAGEIVDSVIVRSLVRSSGRLDYAGADRTLAEAAGPFAGLLGRLDRFAGVRFEARRRSGAVRIDAPEVDLKVGADGVIELERLAGDSRSRHAVTEAMVLAGEIAARFCRRRELPVIFRRQPAPAAPPDLPEAGPVGPVEVRRARMSMRRAQVGLEPGPHYSLGLEAYVQVTSPIRRYQDLALHRQIASALESRPPVYDRDAMLRVLAGTEQAERDARRAERAADDYWTLRYLEERTGQELGATVVQTDPKVVVQLDETLREQAMPALAGVEPGQTLRLRVDRANPRAGILALSRVD